MKTLLIFLLTSLSVYSQVPDSVFIYTFYQLQASRDSVKILKEKNALLENKIVPSLQEIIQRDSLQLSYYDKLKTPAVKDPLFEWQGFYLGISTTYGIDSNVLHNTVLGNLRYAIYGTARLRIGEVELWGGYEIPFNDKLRLRAGIGYRLF